MELVELEIVKEEISKARAQLKKAEHEGASYNDPGVVALNNKLAALYAKEVKLETSQSQSSSMANATAESIQMIQTTLQVINSNVQTLVAVQNDTILLEALSTKSEREVHHTDFENKVSSAYGCYDVTRPNMLRCIVTGQFHNSRKVCKGAHLLAVSESRSMPFVGLERCDVWNERNGLCVLRTIYERFESKELVYMPIVGSPDSYQIEILYDDLLSKPLGISVGELNGTTDATPATFADINHRPLSFTTLIRPYKRVLLYIAMSAFTLALKNHMRPHLLATTASPASWSQLFNDATVPGTGSPPLSDNGIIMQRFLRDV